MLFDEINKIYPKTKFTMTHTTTDRQRSCDKCTWENTYFSTNGSHPPEIVSNIPYSLCMRTNQTCSEKDAKEKRLKELEEMLLERDYPKISNPQSKLSSKTCGFKTCFQKNNQYKTSL